MTSNAMDDMSDMSRKLWKYQKFGINITKNHIQPPQLDGPLYSEVGTEHICLMPVDNVDDAQASGEWIKADRYLALEDAQ